MLDAWLRACLGARVGGTDVMMRSTHFLLTLSAAFFAGSAGRADAEVESLQTRDGTEVRVEDVAGGLDHPWGMAFLPDGRLLVTERAGRLRILGVDETLSRPVAGVPEVYARGQGGLMDVALPPDYEESGYVYLSFAKPGPGGRATTALGRGKLRNEKLEGFEVIFEQAPMVEGPNHFGNRIVFTPDGKHLFFALGERFKFEPAQDLSSHLGKVVRLQPDGRVPEDNPFVNRPGAEGAIWSYGHRNIEAMALQPGTGVLWVAEMGPLGGDELNRIEKGANYGWPKVSWGDHYDGREIPDPEPSSEFEDATRHWSPVISPSGMIFYRGKAFPKWRGSALVGGLSSRALVRLSFDGAKVEAEERLPLPARIRDVEEALDGSILVLTDEADGHIWRLTNMEGAPKPQR